MTEEKIVQGWSGPKVIEDVIEIFGRTGESLIGVYKQLFDIKESYIVEEVGSGSLDIHCLLAGTGERKFGKSSKKMVGILEGDYINSPPILGANLQLGIVKGDNASQEVLNKLVPVGEKRKYDAKILPAFPLSQNTEKLLKVHGGNNDMRKFLNEIEERFIKEMKQSSTRS